MLDITQAELAEKRRLKCVMAVRLFQRQKGKAFVQVTLDGAQVDVELFRQFLRNELFPIVELAQDVRQAVAQGVTIISAGGALDVQRSV